MDDFNALLYGSELVQSAWSRLTRVSYQAWVTAYSTFCHEWHRQPLPVDPDFFICWLERLVTKLAGRTVTVAVSAIVAWCALNNLAHPIKAHPILHLEGPRAHPFSACDPPETAPVRELRARCVP